MGFLSRVRQRVAERREADPWFALPVGLTMLLDAGVSLACQPLAYRGDPSHAVEANSTWGRLLALGPAAFLLAFLAYAAVIAGLLLWLRGALQKLLGVFVMLAHSYGAASWCHAELPERAWWWALMALFLVEASAFALWWRLRERG